VFRNVCSDLAGSVPSQRRLDTGNVWRLFRRKPKGSKPVDLTGAPVKPRVKTYSAESGYVYQYVYRGQRHPGEQSEYVFSVTSDRKSWHPVSVVFRDALVQEWQTSQVRDLLATERYAIAKLSLFQFLDEAESFDGPPAPLKIGSEDISRHLRTLGRL
jgi:hypothetical protein